VSRDNARTPQQIERAHRWRAIRSWILGASIVLAILAAILVITLPGNTTYESGVIESFEGQPTEDGHRLYAIVLLESNQRVRASVPRGTTYVIGAKVKLSATESAFGAITRFRLLGHAAGP
jgi:hypothetical protein